MTLVTSPPMGAVGKDGGREAMGLQPGQVLDGKYSVVRLLGEGGMGAVYEAEHTFLGRKVAIKILSKDFAHNREAIRRFYREAQAAARIGHENICEVTDVGQIVDSPYIVMQLLQGKSLSAAIVDAAPFPMGRAVDVASQMLDALGAAHEAGIVHRDMKPDNVFLTKIAGRDDFVKLLDFGISKVRVAAGGTKLTQEGSVLGTPQYMAPEQARGEADVDGRVDIWAVGVIIYEMLTGRVPFDGPNYNKIIFDVVAAPIPRLRALREGITPELESVVMRAMERDLTKRFRTTAEFRDALLGAWMGQGESGFAVQVARTTPPQIGDEATELAPMQMLAEVAASGASVRRAGQSPAQATPQIPRDTAPTASSEFVADGPVPTFAGSSSPSGPPTTPRGQAAAAKLAARGTVEATPSATLAMQTTLRPTGQPRRRVPLVPAIILGVAVVAIVVFVVIRPFGSSDQGRSADVGQVAVAQVDAGITLPATPPAPPPAADATQIEIASSTVPAVPTPDAGPAVEVAAVLEATSVAAKEVDAAVEPRTTADASTSPRPGTDAGRTSNPPAEAATPVAPTGTLTVATMPVTQVFIDGESFGRTPFVERTIAAGPHRIVFVNEAQGVRHEERLVVIEGRESEIRRSALQLGATGGSTSRDAGTVASPADAGRVADGIRIRRRDAQ
jgi:serine/threonine protein kinase